MVRHLLRVAARAFCLLSLLSCLGTGWLWWRSHRVRDAREFTWWGVRWEVGSDRGRVWLDNGPERRIERGPLAMAERLEREAWKRYRECGASLLEAGRLEREQAENRYKDARWDYEEVLARRLIAEKAYARMAKTPPVSRAVTLAAPAAATALPPLLWLAAWARRRRVLRRRARLGLCPRCGYDLRGTPPGGRCSECGEEAAAIA